jgi:hypothetical protein
MGLKYNHLWEERESRKQGKEKEIHMQGVDHFLHADFRQLEESIVLGREPTMLCLNASMLWLCIMLRERPMFL